MQQQQQPQFVTFAECAAQAKAAGWPDVIGADGYAAEFAALDRIIAEHFIGNIQTSRLFKEAVKQSRDAAHVRRMAMAAAQAYAWTAHEPDTRQTAKVMLLGLAAAKVWLARTIWAEAEPDVLNQLRLVASPPHERRWWMMELCPAIVANAASLPGGGRTLAGMMEGRALLQRVRDLFLKCDYNELENRRAAEPIAAMLGEAPPVSAVLKPGEPWADAALADLASMEPSKLTAWRALLDHASACHATKPAAKWLSRAATLLEPIGGESFALHADRWLSKLATSGAVGRQVVHRGETYDNVPCDASQNVLGGLAWAGAVTRHPRAFAVIADLAETSFRPIPRFGPRCFRVGTAAARALASIGTLEAIGQLARLELRVRTPKGRKLIKKVLTEAIASSGLSRQDVEETSVPDFGLVNGLATIPVGDWFAELDATHAYHPRLTWRKPDGSPAKSAAVVKKSYPDAVEAVQRSLKDVEGMLPAQRTRLELLLRDTRTWRFDAWRQRYLDHGLLAPMVRRLIWTIDGVPVVCVGGAMQDVNGHALAFADAADVAIWHPVGRPVEEVVAWRGRLEALRVAQPFKQAHREVYPVTEAELRTRTYSNRFAAHIVKTAPLIAIGQTRKWSVSLYGECKLDLPQFNVRAEYWCQDIQVDDVGLSAFSPYAYGPQYLSTDQVRFYRPGEGEPMPVADVPPLAFSEVMRDVDLFVGIASVGADPNWTDGRTNRYLDYWQSYSFGDLGETAKTRRAVLERLVPRLKIADRCHLTDKFLVVRGDLRTYKIHLGSGNILMEPNDQYLCIVPARGSALTASGTAADGVFLPFEGDGVLSVVLSKAFLLAADTTITDPTITLQIRTR